MSRDPQSSWAPLPGEAIAPNSQVRPRPEPPLEPIALAALIVALFIFHHGLAPACHLLLSELGVVSPESSLRTFLWCAPARLMVPLLAFTAFHYQAGGLRGTLWLQTTAKRSLFLYVVPTVALIVGFVLLWYQVIAPPPDDYTMPAEQLARTIAGDPLLKTLLLLEFTLTAPMWEELVFRGLLMRGLWRTLGAVPAVLVSSLVFALAHMEPLRFVTLMFSGAVLGALYAYTRNLTLSILAHMAVNVLAVYEIFGV